MNPDELWFNTPDSNTLCRAGGNGPNHPSQLYAIRKCVEPGMSFLDYGCGSATTVEALCNSFFGAKLPDGKYFLGIKYRGLDIIPKNIEWDKENFPGVDFKVNSSIHKIDEPDKSWDVVYSRHVVDHMESFEGALDEHCRVAKKFVIIVLWVPFSNGPEHEIKHIIDQGKTYLDEYTNQYSEYKVMEALHKKEQEGWKLLEVTKDVGAEVKGHDIVIVLQRG